MRLPNIPQDIGNDLVIRACITDGDKEKVAELNGEVHGTVERETVRRWLIEGHPQLDPSGWLFVEDRGSGQAVATLSLMPLTWRFGSVSLPVAELGFVATRPAYRKRGLQRVLSAAFDRIALANGYTLAAIEGIPFFYRQFGYDYALPLFDSRFDLQLDLLPALPSTPWSFRQARPEDILNLMAFYRQSTANLVITTERSKAMWQYFLSKPDGATFGFRLYMISRNRCDVGYLAVAPSGWVNRLNLLELSLSDVASDSEVRGGVEAVLQFACARAHEGNHESVGLQLPPGHPACDWAREKGCRELGVYGWQMKVLDPVGFLQIIGPVLERRLAASAFSGTSGEIGFNLYRLKVGLVLDSDGVRVRALDPDAETHASIPPFAATQLWLGWKSLGALDDWHKDVVAREESRPLLETLFPVLDGKVHIYLGY